MMSMEPRQTAPPIAHTLRTGPVGRLARLALAGLVGWVVHNLWVDRLAIFSPSDGLLEPGLLLVTGLAVHGVYLFADLFDWGKKSLAVLGVLAVAAAVATVAQAGSVWAGPFTWLVWGLDISWLAIVALAALLAAVLGTAGCEIGALRALARRLRGSVDDDKPMFCIIGLGALDRWERRQVWSRSR